MELKEMSLNVGTLFSFIHLKQLRHEKCENVNLIYHPC